MKFFNPVAMLFFRDAIPNIVQTAVLLRALEKSGAGGYMTAQPHIYSVMCKVRPVSSINTWAAPAGEDSRQEAENPTWTGMKAPAQ
jgi:hypothetical protein